MTDYIPRDAVLKAVEPEYRPSLGRQIMSIPAADVAPVVRGKWIDYPIAEDCVQCSVCGALRIGQSNYCPNCGAKMEETE